MNGRLLLRRICLVGAMALWLAAASLVRPGLLIMASDLQQSGGLPLLVVLFLALQRHGLLVEIAFVAAGWWLLITVYVRAEESEAPSSSPGGGASLDAPLLSWSPRDRFTIRDATSGTLVLGATGSGKSSGSGRRLAHAMLRAGFGGLVLTAKNDERAQWESYCRAAGRTDDLLIVDSSCRQRFNPLAHELEHSTAGAGLTQNVVHLLSTILDVADPHAGDGGRGDDAYWRKAAAQLMRNAVDLLALAGERLTVAALYQVVLSAPRHPELVQDPAWQAESACARLLVAADARRQSHRGASDLVLVADYFLREFPQLSDKTRSVIVSTFNSAIDVLHRGLLRDLLCSDSTFTPEAVVDGRILLIDLPVKDYGIVGKLAQVILKFSFQRAVERRDLRINSRPVFLYADEAHHFLNAYDQEFLTTCRSARVATVYLTQNLANFHAVLGGREMRSRDLQRRFQVLARQGTHQRLALLPYGAAHILRQGLAVAVPAHQVACHTADLRPAA